MKFLCSHCKAKYQIADEKVAGRTLRMTCRSCQQEIMIRGDLPVPPAPAPVAVPVPAPLAAGFSGSVAARRPTPATQSALGADFQRQVIASVHAPPLPAPIDEWHVGINEVPVGPMRREEIARKLAAGTVHPDSLAWREGLDDWLPIRNIPELAVLCAPGMSIAPPPLHAPPLHSPAQRTELGPIGGRAGASPAYAMEDWAQVAPISDPNPSQVSINPMLGAPAVERRSGMPSISLIFALAGGFALLMTVVAIFGARWLQGGQQQQAPVAAADVPASAAAPAPAPAAAPAPSAAPAQGDQGAVPEMVIGLEDIQQGDARGTTRPRTPQAGGSTGKQSKKELTAEQKAMLERMGGGDAPSNLNIGSSAVGAAPAKAAGGSLTQGDISKVVLRGRVNLQRCYETALRGSGSSDTVRLDVELTITAAGNATNIKTGGQGLPGMAQCIERTVRMWRFPSSSDATQTKFPLVFQPGS
jgi:predicted Zn finger-like uncharacterized protein